MKPIFTLLFCCTIMLFSTAQQTLTEPTLVPDQNPNFMISQAKYLAIRDSLLLTMNTTSQQTYKAFDWYEAKMERRNTRFENRMQRRLNNNRWNNNWGWNNGWNNNWGWNNGWNNNWNNGWGWNGLNFVRPRIGFNTGNWSFWF
jgi:ribosome-associated translation inhibitor RaiA